MVSNRLLFAIKNPHMFQVETEAQGRLLRQAVTRLVKEPPLEPYQGPKRGKVRGMSRRARKRMLDTMNRIDKAAFESLEFRPKFLTLTYGRDFPTCEESKKHLESFLRKLTRRWSESSGVWRLELQDRGAPHYHLILFGLPFIWFAQLRQWWEESIGFDPEVQGVDHVFIRIEEIKSYKALTNYVSKYCAKMPENIGEFGEADALLDSVPYSDTGRCWGVVNRKSVPWASLLIMRVPFAEWFFKVKRSAKKIYKNIKYNKNRLSGYTLYLNDLDKFVDYVQQEYMLSMI